VRALRAYGTRRSIGQRSTLSAGHNFPAELADGNDLLDLERIATAVRKASDYDDGFTRTLFSKLARVLGQSEQHTKASGVAPQRSDDDTPQNGFSLCDFSDALAFAHRDLFLQDLLKQRL
jgi:hypothetical protein